MVKVLAALVAFFVVTRPSTALEVVDALVVDLNADQGVELEEGDRVARWVNQVEGSLLKDFCARDKGRKVAGSGRPQYIPSAASLQGHGTLIFREQELVNHEEDALDHLITGSGYTWFAVVCVFKQIPRLKDVNSFFGNLRNGGMYEGLWGNVTDDNRVWIGSRNGLTFGRWDKNNPMVAAPAPLETHRFYVVAGRMGKGLGDVEVELFINEPVPVARAVMPVNPQANASKLAIGQERDATNHPGHESFSGGMARFLLYERPLSPQEMQSVMESLMRDYAIR